MDLRSEISIECKKLKIDPARFSPVNIIKWRNIERRIAAKFLRNGLADAKYRWWWEHLKSPVSSALVYDPISTIQKLVPSNESVFLIVEDDSDKFWLYDGYIEEFRLVLEELYHFEYYVVSKKMEWLLCQNHHCYLIASGNQMAKSLEQFS